MGNEKTEEQNYYDTIFNVLNGNNSDGEIRALSNDDDKTFRARTTDEITSRDKEYTNLLKHFLVITRVRNYVKEFFKWTFYLTIIVSIIVLSIITYKLFGRILQTDDVSEILESLPILITSMVGFVSTIIAIPVTITKYLFNTEEDKNITGIILHTQDHDTSGRQWTMDFRNFPSSGKDIKD